ncbi:hypothetical protein LguiA_030749 [Lonicera macranthoides]
MNERVCMAYVVSSLHLEHEMHVCIIIVLTRHLEDFLASSEYLIGIWHEYLLLEEFLFGIYED